VNGDGGSALGEISVTWP